MARIRFDIGAAIARWRTRRPASSRPFRMMDLASLDDRPRGPGWFDSSWDLDQGLEVAVALPGDPPFLAWIEAQARAMQPAPALSLAGAQDNAHVDGALEFETVDWRAWSQPEGEAEQAPAALPVAPALTGLAFQFDLPELELEPLELALEAV